MELKLNIYKNREIEKTYSCDTYDLLFGTVEDFLDLIDIDKLQTGTDKEILVLVGKAIPKGMETIKTLLKDVFVGATDDELKRTKVKEIAKLLVEIIKYSIAEIGAGQSRKN